jgi:hypothetical protein
MFRRHAAHLCFIWARMRVIDESKASSRIKLVQMSFEDFLEALTLLATVKAIPTDGDVANARCHDGGELLLRLQTDTDRHHQFLEDFKNNVRCLTAL